MNNEVINMLVSVQDELARAVLQVNVTQRRDDETIARLQQELQKEAGRADCQARLVGVMQGILKNVRDERDGAQLLLTLCRDELHKARAELASVMAQQEQRRPSAKRSLFGNGGHDIVITLHDLETPKKKIKHKTPKRFFLFSLCSTSR
jgi:hypothetical protein